MIKIYVDGTTLEFSVLENNFDETFRKMGLKEIHWIRRNQSHQWNIFQQVFLLSFGIIFKTCDTLRQKKYHSFEIENML